MNGSHAATSTRATAPVVLVTGAAGGGIGSCSCLRFAKEGYSVVATDITPLDALSKQLKPLLAPGARSLMLKLDVCDSESVQQGVQAALQEFGRIDVLVNNAARSMGSDIFKIDEETWDSNVTLVLKSVYLLSRAVIPIMQEQKSGSIVNIASVNGQMGLGEEAYSAAKAGVVNLSANLAVRYGPSGIRSNCVVPGTIRTLLWDDRIRQQPTIMDTLAKYYPLGRIGTGEDVANAVYFLASEQASWITGTTLNVDGGLLAGNAGLIRDLVPV